MDTAELESLRGQYAEIVAAMEQDPQRAAYHFGRLETVTKRLLRLIDTSK